MVKHSEYIMKKRKKKDRIEALIEKGKEKRFLSYEEVDEALPRDVVDPEEIEDLFQRLDNLDIAVEEPMALKDHREAEEERRILLEEIRNPLRAYLKEVGGTSLLTPTEEVDLARRIDEARKKVREAVKKKNSAKTMRKRVRELERLKGHLIRANLRLVINIAKRYTNPKLTIRDLIQEGNIGLMKAVEKFKYRQGYKFSTYATWWIRQAITRAIADHSATIRIPVHMREKINKLNKIRTGLVQSLDREPTLEEIAKKTKAPSAKVKTILRSMHQEPISLEMPIGDDGKTTFGDFMEDKSKSSPANSATKVILAEEIEKIFLALDEREKEILRLRFGLKDKRYQRTLEEVGRYFNLTRERIRQIEAKSLEKLRRCEKLRKLRSLLGEYLSS